MGCNEDVDENCLPDELPYHQVLLSEFEIDETEVTVDAYQACVDGGTCAPRTEFDAYGQLCEQTTAGDAPVNCVTWFQARDFCEWAGKTLPTEAQWEKAARSDDGRVYPWGNEAPACNLLIMDECGDGVARVGSRPDGASPYGALDMAGNLFEWTAVWYSTTYYSESPHENPRGPTSGMRRTIRSAAPNYTPVGLRLSQRRVDWEVLGPDTASSLVGFRCVI